MRRVLVLLALMALVAGACTSADETTTSVAAAPTPPTTSVPPSTVSTTATAPPPSSVPPVSDVIPADLTLEPFGAFDEIPLLDDDVPYEGPATPKSLTNVTIHPPLAAELADPDLRATLSALGFAVVPGDARLFHHVYELSDYEPYPVFVTTDAAFHAWHLAFDKVLRDAEENALLPVLEELIGELVARARSQREEYTNTPLADASDRAAQFYEAAATLLELDIGPIGELATEEVALVMAHDAVTESPTIGMHPCSIEHPGSCVFYELFKPRGHYTRSAELERFFRAMSLLGQGPFPLDAESLTVGMMALRPLLSSDSLIDRWQRIYEPTAFLVGAADDYTPFELATAAADVTPDGLNAPLELADPAVMAEVATRLSEMRPVEINPEAASVRTMGVRLTLDALILDQLVFPNLNRMVASVRDVAAAFGSEWAYISMEADGYTDYDGYDEALGEMRAKVAARTIADWSRTVYDAWLYAIAAVWADHETAFPDFMQTPEWTAKAHQTGFGSYAELKHDTILYTKQAIAEGGNGGTPPPPPRHWVEPDPVAYERIGAAAAMLLDGLSSRDLISSQLVFVLEYLGEEMELLARVARDELAGRPISAEDNARLQSFGGWLESIWLNTSDLDLLGEDGGPDEDAALIADILRSFEEGALEIGTGKVDTIYVLVPDDEGVFQVTKGAVYSFYEFWRDPSDRLTDEQWRAMLEAGTAPPRPAWADVFLVK